MTRYWLSLVLAMLALALWGALSMAESEVVRLAVKSFLETRGTP